MEVKPSNERLTSNQRRRRAADARLSATTNAMPLSPLASSSRTNPVPALYRSVSREEPPLIDVHALLPSSRPRGPPAAVSLNRMHTTAVARDVTSKQNSSLEPSLGSDEDDDEKYDFGALALTLEDEPEPEEFRTFSERVGDLSWLNRDVARLSAEIAAVGRQSVRAGQAAPPPVKRDLSKDWVLGDLPPGWSLTRLRDELRADAVLLEAQLRAEDPNGTLVNCARSEAEWRQCVVLVGASAVKFLEWDHAARAPYGASSAVQLAADAAAAAAAAAAADARAAEMARAALIPPYVRPASCAPAPLGWYAASNVRARAAAAAAADSESDSGARGGSGGGPPGGGRGGSGSARVRDHRTPQGARCVPYTGDVESECSDLESEGGDVEGDDFDIDAFAADPSQW